MLAVVESDRCFLERKYENKNAKAAAWVSVVIDTAQMM
jgi:hypothetical protein